MPNAIQLHQVCKAYGETQAVANLDLCIAAGSVYGLLGPNGSGKTTTIRMIMNILMPDQGEIQILGRPAGRKEQDQIGYLPEERGLYAKMKILDQLTYFGELKNVPRAEARRRGQHWLQRLELSDWADKKVNELSKGMQQKLQFAVTLLADPPILILDELTSGLDPVNASLVREVLLELRGQGKTILFSTHRMEDAERLCDSICLIAQGRKLLDGNLNQIRAGFGKQTARIEFTGEAQWLHQAPGVRKTDLYDSYAELQLQSADAAPEVVRFLAPRVNIRKFEILVPSLDEIFLTTVAAAQSSAARPEREPAHAR